MTADNMTEEEKKALEEFKKWLQYEKNNKDKIDRAEELIKIQTTILNLIEKLQKENEEKDKKILGRKFYEVDLNELLKENYIAKDKIKAKIEELEQQKDLFFEKAVIQGRIDLLKELLEEEGEHND